MSFLRWIRLVLLAEPDVYVLDELDTVLEELGFRAYTASTKSTVDMFAITLALMIGTAGLPHVIVDSLLYQKWPTPEGPLPMHYFL